MANLLIRLRFPASVKSLRDLARLLIALALIGFALQPVAIAMAGGPPMSRQDVAKAALSGTTMAMAGHDCDGHDAGAPRTPAPIPAHAHAAACLAICCFATLPDPDPAAIAYDMTSLSRIPAPERRPADHLPSLDPPPPKFS